MFSSIFISLLLEKVMGPHSSTLAWKIHGWRSLVRYSPRDHEESDTTGWLDFYFSLSCIGEGNGNPLQCSCLENPWDGGAWWAAISGVAQSQTRLKRLSSSKRWSNLLTVTDSTSWQIWFWIYLWVFQAIIPQQLTNMLANNQNETRNLDKS